MCVHAVWRATWTTRNKCTLTLTPVQHTRWPNVVLLVAVNTALTSYVPLHVSLLLLLDFEMAVTILATLKNLIDWLIDTRYETCIRNLYLQQKLTQILMQLLVYAQTCTIRIASCVLFGAIKLHKERMSDVQLSCAEFLERVPEVLVTRGLIWWVE